MMSGVEDEDFKDDIRQHGMFTPIAVNPKGIVLGGLNRLRACREVSIETTYEVFDLSPDEEVSLILSMNLRRHNHLVMDEEGEESWTNSWTVSRRQPPLRVLSDLDQIWST